MKNIIGDILQRPAFSGATIALMDINRERGWRKAPSSPASWCRRWASARRSRPSDQRRALTENADFVVVAFQIGGYEPCTVTDFEVPKKYGLRQTIADTLGRRRHHARPAHRAASVEHLRGHAARSAPGDHAAICEPDGHQHLGHRREISDDPAGRALPFGAGNGA
jgi:hypothetical protein